MEETNKTNKVTKQIEIKELLRGKEPTRCWNVANNKEAKFKARVINTVDLVEWKGGSKEEKGWEI